jgi:hypothetical protein
MARSGMPCPAAADLVPGASRRVAGHPEVVEQLMAQPSAGPSPRNGGDLLTAR